jgi:hypothetical protein
VNYAFVRDSGSQLVVANTDYGHTMAKSLVFAAQIQIPILNRYLGFGYKGLVFL